MSLCDRCPGGLTCCLDYLGKVCAARRFGECGGLMPTNFDVIQAMEESQAASFIFEHGQHKTQTGTLLWLRETASTETLRRYGFH